MLQYQSGEYCICIWDSDKTNLGDAIRSIGQYVNDEKDANEDRQALLELADAVTVCLVAVKELSCTEEELQKKLFSILGEEIGVNIDRMRKCLDDLAAAYPEEYSKAMTMKAARMMLCNERHVIRNLTYDGIMSKKDGDMMEDSIDTRSEKLM